MSASETLALVRRYYDPFNAKDWAGALGCLSDDVAHHVNEGRVRTGVAEFQQFLDHMARCYDEQLADMIVMANADGTRAAAEFTVHGKYIGTNDGLPQARGQSCVLPAGAFLKVRDGKIGRVTTYYNLKAWLAQIG